MVEEISDFIHPGASRFVRLFGWLMLVVIFAAMLAIILVLAFNPNKNENEGDVVISQLSQAYR